MKKNLDVYERYRDRSELVRFAMAPHAPYTVTDEHLVAIWHKAEELDMTVTMHVHETELEVKTSVDNIDSPFRHKSDRNCRPIKNLQRMGFLGRRLVAAHMVQLDEDDIGAFADAGGLPPGSNVPFYSLERSEHRALPRVQHEARLGVLPRPTPSRRRRQRHPRHRCDFFENVNVLIFYRFDVLKQ